MAARRLITAVAVIAGLALGGVAYGVQRHFADPRPAWPASLTIATGEPAQRDALFDRPAVIFFGYTHCPDFCPTALAAASAALAELGPAAAKTRIIFMTLDPERDTAAVLRDYLGAFDSRIVGVTGPPAAIAAAAHAFGVYFEKRGQGPDYAIDHTAAFVVTDGRGRIAAVLGYDAAPAALAEAVAAVWANGRDQ